MSQYIKYRYEPCIEELDDARYFTEHWEQYIYNHTINWKTKEHKINYISLK